MYHLVSLAAKATLAAAASLSGHTSATPAYTVQPGDTLSSIAAASGTTWQAVYAANRPAIGGDPDVLYAGERLALPGGDGYDSGQAAPEAPAQAPAAAAGSTGGASGSAGSSYMSCVRFRESTDGQASSDQFGITPSTWSAFGFTGSPYTASYSEQVAAFQTIYAAVGTSAWSPYDGC